MNIASIDIGTNTAILLIMKLSGEGDSPIPLLNEYRVPRVGKSAVKGGNIPVENANRLLRVLKKYRELCLEYDCVAIKAVATNAFRIARNSEELVYRIKNETGISVDVISGETEAALTFAGAYNTTSTQGEKLLIDIGGGSTELVTGIAGNIIFRKSFQMGVVTFTEKFIMPAALIDDAIKQIRHAITEQLNRFLDFIPKRIETIAVAGTPTTLACILQNARNYSDELVDGSIIKTDVLEKIIEQLKPLSPNEVKQKFGQVVEGREDILLSGVIILQAIAKIFKIDEIVVSSRGLRFGAAMSLAAELQEQGRV